jgi:hypothetical protein
MSKDEDNITMRGIRMPVWVWEGMKEIAKEDDRPTGYLIVTVLKGYIEQWKRESE